MYPSPAHMNKTFFRFKLAATSAPYFSEFDHLIKSTLFDVNEAGVRVVVGQGEGVGAESVPHGSDAGALELRLLLVPQLGEAALGLDLVARLHGGDALDAALLRAAQANALLAHRFSDRSGD